MLYAPPSPRSPIPGPLVPFMPMIVGVVTALLVFVIGWLASKWTHSIVTKVLTKRAKDETLARFIATLAQYLVLAATVITALARVGVETVSLVALLGSASLALGLALQGSLAHFASGVLLVVFRPFTIGDSVKAGGESGSITEVGLFATVLTTIENHRVVVPNGKVMSDSIINYSALGRRCARLPIGVAYGSDIDQVTKILLEAASSVSGVLEDPEPQVLFTGFGASSLDFSVVVWAENQNFWGMQPNIRKAIYEHLNAANIDIPFDQLVIHRAPD